MNENESKMIECMEFIRTFCKEQRQCLYCPMFDNCSNKLIKEQGSIPFPAFWYIPEV